MSVDHRFPGARGGALPASPQKASVSQKRRNEVVHTEAAYVIDPSGYQRALFVYPYHADDVVRTVRGLSPR